MSVRDVEHKNRHSPKNVGPTVIPQRHVVVLHFIHGVSIAVRLQVAQVTDVSDVVVRRTVSLVEGIEVRSSGGAPVCEIAKLAVRKVFICQYQAATRGAWLTERASRGVHWHPDLECQSLCRAGHKGCPA